MKRAVILVDSKSRDLMGDALIAHHLEKRGIDCKLEPLASWRSCVGAWKPDFILFNHLGAQHLADFSQQCRKWGIVTGVLLNEGICYVEGDLQYISRRTFDNIHCDLMLSWNELHRQELIGQNFCETPKQVVAVGVPRFDFYKAPWKRLYEKKIADTDRPVILANANFPLAPLNDLQPEVVDRFFAPWKDEIPIYADYWNAVRAQKPGREKFLEFVETLLEADKYYVIVRPHPRENASFYEEWVARLPEKYRRQMRLAVKENITELIINCDLELSCENCTTALEAWVVGKPTVGLAFSRHPFSYTPEIAALLPECDDPSEIVSLVDAGLADPKQEAYTEGRWKHIEKWTYRIDGRAAERVADQIAAAIEKRPGPKKISLGLSDIRRGLKLRLTRLIGEPSNATPWLIITRLLQLKRGLVNPRYLTYLKGIRPAEEKHARKLIRSLGQ